MPSNTTPCARSAAVMRRFAPVLGVSLDWLLNGLGSEPTREQIRAAVEAARARRKEAA